MATGPKVSQSLEHLTTIPMNCKYQQFASPESPPTSPSDLSNSHQEEFGVRDYMTHDMSSMTEKSYRSSPRLSPSTSTSRAIEPSSNLRLGNTT